METSATLLLLAVTVLVVLFIVRPLPAGWKNAVADDQRRSVLLAERERILTALQELDIDQQLGKIPEQDFLPERTLLVQRGADTIRQLDGLGETAAAPARKRRPANDQDRLAGRARKGGIADEQLEDLLARRRSALHAKTAGFCPGCGKPVLTSDRFCPACGRAID